jgi:hypothetical protein
MKRNLDQFSEFQRGFIQAIAEAIGGYVTYSILNDTATAIVKNRKEQSVFLWQLTDEPNLWDGTKYVSLLSKGWTLPEYLTALQSPAVQLGRVADALNDLLDSGAIENMGDAADAAAKFFDSLGDATVDDEDEDDDGD